MIPFMLVAALAASDPAEGVEGLCAQVAKLAAPQIAGKPAALQVVAEGPAYDLAGAVTGRCTADLFGEGHAAPLANAERVVRVRLRHAAPSLVALVEVTGQGTVLLSQSVEVPAGAALARWLGAAGTGVETWVAGSVEGEVIALCGDDPDGNGKPEVAFITRSAIEVARWTTEGFEHVAHVDLPPSLRARARAPAASAGCRSEDGALVVAFGIHDRGRGGVLRVEKGAAKPIEPIDGVPFGFSRSGQPLVADGVAGTALVRWKGSTLAALTVVPPGRPKSAEAADVIGVTQSGTSARFGSSFRAGTALAVADVGQHKPSLVFTQPVFPDSGAEDHLVVASLDDPPVVRGQSQPVHGPLGAIGVVSVGTWQRILAVQWRGGRSQIYALGTRMPPAAP